MTKFIAALVIALLASSCATRRTDYSLMWDSQSAVLYIYSPDGSPMPIAGDQLLTVPGYLFSHGAIHLHPGEQPIGYSCPRTDGIILNDVIPYVRHNFQAGHVYELHCKDGSPLISERPDGA
jgi:hypothetical protein